MDVNFDRYSPRDSGDEMCLKKGGNSFSILIIKICRKFSKFKPDLAVLVVKERKVNAKDT